MNIIDPTIKAVRQGGPLEAQIEASGTAYVKEAIHLPSWIVEVSQGPCHNARLLERRFLGAGGHLVSRECAVLNADGGVSHVQTDHPFLNESCDAHAKPMDNGEGWRVKYHLERDGNVSEREETIRHPLLSLSALPWLIASQKDQLMSGQAVLMTYPVLKVQRSATVRLWLVPAEGLTQVLVSPTNPILQLIFGSTKVALNDDLTEWHGYEGLLDPRDRKANGRWRDVLGRIEFEDPIKL